jgi:divinyl protochlorophyllide a 8-vinyl-reductase
MAQAITAARGPAVASSVFHAAGCGAWIADPPTEMIAETDVARLHDQVRARFAPGEAKSIADDAGRRTARYILAHRIPGPAQALLKALPATLALPALSTAIAAHAWTFAGSGAFSARGRTLRIAHNPLAPAGPADAPACHWHAAVFETLLRTLVSPTARVREHACCAMGAPACTFVVTFDDAGSADSPP